MDTLATHGWASIVGYARGDYGWERMQHFSSGTEQDLLFSLEITGFVYWREKYDRGKGSHTDALYQSEYFKMWTYLTNFI